jgi:putative membrane protein
MTDLLVLVLGGLFWWLSCVYPAAMPGLLPVSFGWIAYLGLIWPTLWYCRGLRWAPRDERPHWLRRSAFFAGIAVLYVVMLTRFDDLAQHMFLLNRIQQATLHHLGPFLLGLAWPGEMLSRGAPDWVLRCARTRWVQRIVRILLHPVVASVLFVGVLWLWLWPTVQFRMMLSAPLFAVMNLSLVLDGLLFWFLVLDPRPSPPAGHSYAVRLVTCVAVIFPQLFLGSWLIFGFTVLYPQYEWFGRVFPSIEPLLDQHLGGLVVWIPSSLMSSIAFMLIMNHVRLDEDRNSGGNNTDDIEIAEGVKLSSTSWTGR